MAFFQFLSCRKDVITDDLDSIDMKSIADARRMPLFFGKYTVRIASEFKTNENIN